MTLFSSSWHAVARLKPRLASRVRIHRRRFRGQAWYVLHDPLTDRYHRLTPQAYALVAAMDGRRSVADIWNEACASLGPHLPGQEELVRLLSQFHQQDILVADVAPDQAELFQRYKKQKWQRLRKRLFDPLSLKWPLFNPDPWLTRLAPHLRFLFDWRGALLYLALVLPALMLAATHWQALTNGLSERVLSAHNLLVLWLVYPLVKALHELGHALATKRWGGAVREVGLMFIVFAPVPYVDASASHAFESRWQRMMVAAAGILTEVGLAALAMLVWACSEPGLVRTVAFNVMLVGALSTLLVNGNPLMRFDGYFILTDLIDMPNLAQRGQRYLAYLCDRYLFRAPGLAEPAETPAEKRWLLFYAPASWLYRIFISIQLLLFIATRYFFIGVLISLWIGVMLLALPAWRAWWHVWHGPTLLRIRQRAIRLALGLTAAAVILLCALPLPFFTVTEGVIWMPERAILRAQRDGFLDTLLAAPGSQVAQASAVALLRNGQVETGLAVARAAWREAEAEYRNALTRDALELGLKMEKREQARRTLDIAGAKAGQLMVTARTDGRFIYAHKDDLQGRYFKRGEIIGYLDAPQWRPVVRIVVSQDDIDWVRRRTRGVQVRLAPELQSGIAARILREVPAGQAELPTAALSFEGGGKISTDPRQADGTHALQRYFQLDLQLLAPADLRWLGARAHVRFDHGYRPLAAQAWFRVRQVFLRDFNV